VRRFCGRRLAGATWDLKADPLLCRLSGLRRVEGDSCDRCGELGWLDRLRQMHLKSCREDTSPIFGARVAGQGDGGQKAAVDGFMLANPSDQRISVFIGETDIADRYR
jgi:hypothetical protein